MPNPTAKPRRRWLSSLLAMTLALLASCLLTAATAPAKSNSEKLEAVEEKIGKAEEREGLLTSDIAAMGDEISALEGQVSALRNQEAAAEEELAAKEAELQEAEAELKEALERLDTLKARLKRALVNLRERLVAIYTYGTTDITEVILSSEDYGDMVARTAYFDAINESDEALAERVRSLRDEAKKLVRQRKIAKLTIEDARDAIAAKEQRLEATRSTLESREGALLSARSERRQALKSIENDVDEHEEIAADLRAQIAQEIAEATGGVALPAGPMPSPSAAGFIWPVEGTVTSGFGYRWGRMHEGIDISVPEGTPIRAAADGTVILEQSEYESGGYGNYTCVDHGGGLSTCYAHQSSFAVSTGASVNQGDVIGYSGNTGHSTGPHLHFEVRINGAPTDPLGYL
ncbi:MAG TPA: peptidoglycan DD-metalloendopeptidase family protein [Solirubrobacterales bacterium]|jgi:murein DD-endopeptidase MepM/ murein hydrolase activator NlpD|nr:peptidoglycan DD-metalloendopeptidase family protein [Solirubrobacterales bacterium]